MNSHLTVKYILTLSLILLTLTLKAQAPQAYTSAEIHHSIKKLQNLGKVLYIAAHPDDENTNMIAWMANDLNVETAYLSLTRGDGGQNMIGSEMKELLGVIRTQELLKARSVDGGKQFFTRASDFGYSKNPEETFTVWDRETLLSDMVWIIRTYKPDVMITRFPHTPAPTHGHHTASAQLAYEAFDAAADENRFPEQLIHEDPWQAKRLLFNTSKSFYSSKEAFEQAKKDLLAVDVGTYYPVYGRSNNEIAAESRSQHQCQGMGTPATRGKMIEYLEHLKGEKAEKELFENVPTGWSRLEGGQELEDLLKKIEEEFDFEQPWLSVEDLLVAREKMQSVEWQESKARLIDQIIWQCLGLYAEVLTDDYSATANSAVSLKLEIINRSPIRVEIEKVKFTGVDGKGEYLQQALPANEVLTFERQLVLANLEFSCPYYLREEKQNGFFHLPNMNVLGLPEMPPSVGASVWLKFGEQSIQYDLPAVYKEQDFRTGDAYRPFVVTPKLTANLSEKILVFGEDAPKSVEVLVKAGTDDVKEQLQINLPEGWKSEPTYLNVDLEKQNDEQLFRVQLSPPADQSTGELTLSIGEDRVKERIEIAYDHIPTQLFFLDSKAQLTRVDLKKAGTKIGYIKGSGDAVPVSLRQVGFEVTELKDEELTADKFEAFDAVIVGIRAYNVRDRMKFAHAELMKYTENGGTVIVQYTTKNRFSKVVIEPIGPYPFDLSSERVIDETATVKMLDTKHPVFHFPNKITDKDFDNWVQERGLYFANQWDDQYATVMASHDPGEDWKAGGLLIAKHGKGHYVYTGYSWFRQLPAGVPGAYRLFVNLIALGAEE